MSSGAKPEKLSWRARWRRLRLGLPTILGANPGGYFIPYRYAAQTQGIAGQKDLYRLCAAYFASKQADFRALWEETEGFAEDLLAIPEQGPPPSPRWGQDWFPRMDAALAYGLIRARKPQKIVEVGSGHSTRFVWRALQDGGLKSDVTAIDPAPRADIDKLPITLIKSTLQAVELQPFRSLQAGDFLLVDSSHIAMPGSDLDRLIAEVLPALPTGVLIQFHDIFLPDDYPAAWRWRGYNEQHSLLALLAGGGWDVLFSNHYVLSRHPDWLAKSPLSQLPLPHGAIESALWLIKKAPSHFTES